MAAFEWKGLPAMLKKLSRLENPDPTPLMNEWRRIIEADNKQGVMAGTDKNDRPMTAVTYRPVNRNKPAKVTKAQRNNSRNQVSGYGPLAAGLHNNLSAGEYRHLGGPPMAPRGIHSRVITNLLTAFGRDPGDHLRWFAIGAWAEVVDQKGNPFLTRAFRTRDLRGLRRAGMAKARAALLTWVTKMLRSN